MPSDMLRQLLGETQWSPPDALKALNDTPGIYAIFVDNPDSLPHPFRGILQGRNTQLIYIGKASKSLSQRLGEQELRHKRAATFFRSLGAVLGYRPQAGSLKGKKNQNNYRFTKDDTQAIIDWIDQHLKVSWLEIPVETIGEFEPALLNEARPLFNDTHNPDRLKELKRLREQCRQIARGDTE